MVRQFTPPADQELDSERVDIPPPPMKMGVQDEDRTRSLRFDLGEAFSRFQSCNPKLSFSKLLSKWVAKRKKAKLPVDYDDPDATQPSPIFRAFLKRKFDQNGK